MKHASVPQLVAISDGVNITLDKPIVLLGRHQECDVQIPSRKISRRHCLLAQVNDHFVVRDLGSTNGIRINGIKVVEGNLQPEDELMVGNVRYLLKWGPAGEKNHIAENGIQALPMAIPLGEVDESCEEPMPLPDAVLSKIAQMGKPRSMEISGEIVVVPIEPPPK